MTRDPSRTARIVALLRQACVRSGTGNTPEGRSWLMNSGILSAITTARSRRIHDVREESMQSSIVDGAGVRGPRGSL